MQYAELECEGRVASIAVEPTGWGRPYKELHEKADAGHVVWGLYSHAGFKNPFHQADVTRHQERGYWAELFRDTIRGREKELGETPPEADSIPVTYVAGSGLPFEIMLNTWLPRNGLIVPVRDAERGYRLFKPHTLVPEMTVPFGERARAEMAFTQFGLPLEEISGFYRLDDYRNRDRFAGRSFNPGFRGDGRFGVTLGGHPSSSGLDGVASLPAYGRLQILMEVKAFPQEAKAK